MNEITLKQISKIAHLAMKLGYNGAKTAIIAVIGTNIPNDLSDISFSEAIYIEKELNNRIEQLKLDKKRQIELNKNNTFTPSITKQQTKSKNKQAKSKNIIFIE